MARKSKTRRTSKADKQLPDVFAFTIIVFIIIMSFSVIALVVSANPL
ncbi:MAG: hypothetical protein AAB583_01160 [Patescibacteria group bacterium]